MCHASQRFAALIRVDSIWLATEPLDMRAGTETALARVIAVFGAAQPHCAYLDACARFEENSSRLRLGLCDDYGGYKASFALGVTEIGCMAHARRKFYELHTPQKSILAEQALQYIAALYEVEREIRDLEPDERRRIRQEKAAPLMETLHAWMIAQRELVFEGLIITRALDYSLKRWTALSR